MTDDELDYAWQMDECAIDGGFCGCEYPRLWPPRILIPQCADTP
jgi:hypothetical protein